MSIFPAGYLNSHKDDADDAIDIYINPVVYSLLIKVAWGASVWGSSSF